MKFIRAWAGVAVEEGMEEDFSPPNFGEFWANAHDSRLISLAPALQEYTYKTMISGIQVFCFGKAVYRLNGKIRCGYYFSFCDGSEKKNCFLKCYF